MFGMKTATATVFALILSVGVASTPPVDAHTQQGLVNVTVGDIETGDILSNNNVTVGVAAALATQVCGIQVQAGVLSALLGQAGPFKCENKQDKKFVQITSSNGPTIH